MSDNVDNTKNKQWFDIEYKVKKFRDALENHNKEISLLKNGKIPKRKLKLIDEMVEEHRQKLRGEYNV
tara:strand:- start:125 stop:328 length:204 start_codon:yes stop_codon:yes gene_type:complete